MYVYFGFNYDGVPLDKVVGGPDAIANAAAQNKARDIVKERILQLVG